MKNLTKIEFVKYESSSKIELLPPMLRFTFCGNVSSRNALLTEKTSIGGP